ncbi:hypothetical protein SAMN05216533_0129 [Streptomyces sp. Ag109_O5-10]|nr:hypothetical protein SAMN05216533_0129 [Streptomyces sp. Ag109_O5-10]
MLGRSSAPIQVVQIWVSPSYEATERKAARCWPQRVSSACADRIVTSSSQRSPREGVGKAVIRTDNTARL